MGFRYQSWSLYGTTFYSVYTYGNVVLQNLFHRKIDKNICGRFCWSISSRSIVTIWSTTLECCNIPLGLCKCSRKKNAHKMCKHSSVAIRPRYHCIRHYNNEMSGHTMHKHQIHRSVYQAWMTSRWYNFLSNNISQHCLQSSLQLKNYFNLITNSDVYSFWWVCPFWQLWPWRWALACVTMCVTMITLINKQKYRL